MVHIYNIECLHHLQAYTIYIVLRDISCHYREVTHQRTRSSNLDACDRLSYPIMYQVLFVIYSVALRCVAPMVLVIGMVSFTTKHHEMEGQQHYIDVIYYQLKTFHI